MNPTKIVELVIADDSEELAIDAISLVTSPAIETDFVYFGKEKNNLTFAKVDEEKRMLISPALIPNKQIFRHDPNTSSDYYVYFSKETVQKASELYLKHNNHHKATYQHQDRVSGVLTVESWIIEDSKLDKSTLYGFSLPVGTWMVKMHITNEEMWQKVKSGELKGLSIEGYFTNKFEQMNNAKPSNEQILSALNELIKESKTEMKSEKVELAGDIVKLLGRSKAVVTFGKNIEITVKELKDIKNSLDVDNDGLTTEMKSVSKGVDQAEKAAKELGLNANDIPNYKEAVSALKYGIQQNKIAKKLL